jgi:N-acetyl-gamma-glutamyl-phosphate reductase
MNKIKVSIAGGTGYTGGELLRLLLNHPAVEIVSVLSTTSAGTRVDSIHRDLLGDTDLICVSSIEDGEAPDIIFLCLGHGLSREFLNQNNIPEGCKIIDLGNDFRVESSFGEKNFIYGLAELRREEISRCNYLANPGCFATCIQLALLPLAAKGLISDEIHIHAITGSTGAGKKLAEPSHFSYRNSNISVYKSFTHQHLAEIGMTLSDLQGAAIPQINFVPMRGDFTRGIFGSIYTKCCLTKDEAVALYKEFYQGAEFVKVSDEGISLKEVVNTNKSLLHVEMHNGYIHITSIIDNLVKGASGQAVQNMNLMFGLPENTGLKLKAGAF